MASGLLELTEYVARQGQHEVEAYADYIEAAFAHRPRTERAAALLADVSRRVCQTGVSWSGVGGLPGIQGPGRPEGIPRFPGYVVYRLLKTALYVGAMYKAPADIDRLLLIVGVALGIPQVKDALVHNGRSAPSRIIKAMAPGGTARFAQVLQDVVSQQTLPGESLPQGTVVLGGFLYVCMAAAGLAAEAFYNDSVFTRAEMEALDAAIARRAAALMWLLQAAAEGDGQVLPHEADLLLCIKNSLQLMDRRALEDARRELGEQPLDQVFPYVEERTSVMAVLAEIVRADGHLDRHEVDFCHHVGEMLQLSPQEVDTLLTEGSSEI